MTPMPTAMIIDMSHDDDLPDGGFAALRDSKEAEIVGVILKSSQGPREIDDEFASRYVKAIEAFGAGCVHSYHFLDGSDPTMQIAHYLDVTSGKPGRWLDYEENPASQCTDDQFLSAVRNLQAKQRTWPGNYGSELDLLGNVLAAGHCGPCGKWIANYDRQPRIHWDLWQFTAGESKKIAICGHYYDLNTFNGTADECRTWMKAMAA